VTSSRRSNAVVFVPATIKCFERQIILSISQDLLLRIGGGFRSVFVANCDDIAAAVAIRGLVRRKRVLPSTHRGHWLAQSCFAPRFAAESFAWVAAPSGVTLMIRR
jgi:hypothetical protein